MVEVGRSIAGTDYTSIGVFNPGAGQYRTFFNLLDTADGNGTITNCGMRYCNDSGITLSLNLCIYACTPLGINAQGTYDYMLTKRSTILSTTAVNGTSGVWVNRSFTGRSAEVRLGDVIGLEVYWSSAGNVGGGFDVATGTSEASEISGAIYKGRVTTSATIVTSSSSARAYKLYGTGPDFEGGSGGIGGGGVGGSPRDACHSVTEGVEQDAISTGLWGVVRPRDFGVSGGDSAAYVDLTFPWDTAGTYHSDEVFIDGVTKSYTRANNPLERYTLKMDVLRYTGDRPDITISNGEFETNDTWTGSGSGEYSSAYVGGVAHSGSRSRVLALGDTTDSTVGFSSGDYAAVSQTISAMQEGTVYFYWRWGYLNISVTSGTSVVEVLLDGVVVWDEVINDYGAANTWYAASIAVSEGDHTLTFRHRATSTKVPGILFVWIDSVESSTSNVPTGRVYNFHECWWIEATSGDVYVAPATGSDSNLGFSWDEAYATLQKGLDEVGKGGVVHVKCHTTVHRVSNISDSKIIKPYTEGSYNKIYITK
ncbi:MAG: hypothetical protein WC109_01710 [Syntrophomonadaceae bacterium]